VNDKDIMRLLKLIVKARGKIRLVQGGPLSPLLSNIYLNEVDKMLEKVKKVFRRHVSQLVDGVVYIINPILRGWTNYFRISNSSYCFCYIKDWVEKKGKESLMKSCKWKGFGWKKWSRRDLYTKTGLYNDCQIRYYSPLKAIPAKIGHRF
jgi:hypothetical protein